MFRSVHDLIDEEIERLLSEKRELENKLKELDDKKEDYIESWEVL